MELSDLVTFSTVARTGGVTRAAEELNTVQSNITQRVKAVAPRIDGLGTPSSGLRFSASAWSACRRVITRFRTIAWRTWDCRARAPSCRRRLRP